MYDIIEIKIENVVDLNLVMNKNANVIKITLVIQL